jgi:hypothetical protein
VKLWINHKKKILATLSSLLFVLIAAVAVLVYFVTSEDFQVLAADNIVRVIQERSGMTTTLEGFEIDFPGQNFALNGLVLRGNEDPSDPPLLSIDRVEVGIRWRGLLTRQVDLNYLEVARPQFRLEIGDNGSTNLEPPPPGPEGEPSSFQLFIGDLVVTDGTMSFDEERVNIDFQLEDFGGSFDYAEATSVLSGHIEYDGAIARQVLGDIPYTLAADFDYTQGTALVSAVELRSGDTALQLQGSVRDFFRRRLGNLAYTGTVAFPFMNYFFPEEEFQGQMEVAGELDFSTIHFATTGAMNSGSLRFDDWTAMDVTSDYSYSFPERVLGAQNFDAAIFGGRAVGDLNLLPLPGDGRVELDIRYSDIDFAQLSALYPWDARYLIRSSANGTMAGWFRGAFDDFDLSGGAILSPYPPESLEAIESADDIVNLPLTGTTRYRGTPGQIEVDGLTGQYGSTTVEATGVIRRDDFELDASMRSGDLAELAFVDPRLNGSGEFEGVIGGQLARPRVDGRLALRNYTNEGRVIDQLAGQIRFENEVVTLNSVEVTFRNSEAVLNGSIDVTTGRPDLEVEVVRLIPADLEEAGLGEWAQYPITGSISGEVYVDSIDPFSASGDLIGVNLGYDGQDLGDAEADVIVRPDQEVQLRNLQVRLGESLIEGMLDFNRQTNRLRVEMEASGHMLQDLQWLGIPDVIQGRVRAAEFVVEGTPTSPLVAGQVSIEGLQFRQQFFPSAEVNLSVEDRGDGASMVVARIAAGDQLTLDVDLNTLEPDFPFEGKAQFTAYDASRMTAMAPGTVTATGTAQFSGELTDFQTLEGNGEVDRLAVRLDENNLIEAPSFTFDFDDQEVDISSVDLSDETTFLSVEGEVSLAPDAPIDLRIEGDLDLSLLYPSYIDFETTGILSIRGDIVGTLRDPELDGSARLSDFAMDYPGLLLGLSGMNGDLAFDGDTVTLINVRGASGGGTVEVNGTIAIEGIRPGQMELAVDAADVRLRTPEGLRTVFDTVLLVRGTPEAPSIEGNVEVISLSYDESFEDFLALFEEATAGGLSSDAGLLDGLSLALHIEGDEDIRIENDLARVDARIDLDIGGTFGQPTMTGHVESLDGVLDFNGNRYLITRGTVDFVDPVGIEPRIEMQAETELRDYRVILSLSGPASDVRIELSSDPPLPQLEVVSLVAGGRTREELADDNGVGALPTSEELFQGAAASTLMNDLIQERVGSRFGLGSLVRIDPFLVGAENDPVARLTISEQITRDLIITYSQDLSSNRQEIILIEYFLNNNTSFIASRDETGSMGLDIRLRKRFR